MKAKHLQVLFTIAAVLILLLAVIELTSGMGGGNQNQEGSAGTQNPTAVPNAEETPDASAKDPSNNPSEGDVKSEALQIYLSRLSAATDKVYNENTTLEGLIYNNTDERKYFLLPGVKMTDGDQNGKITEKYYEEEYFNEGYTCVLTFKDNGMLAEGTYPIADSLIDTVTVTKGSGKTKLTINARKKIICFASWFMDYEKSHISIFEAPDSTKQLVVIDPGHGGADSGAWKNGTGETIYNLAVATELARLLREDGIQVIMLRNSDVFLEVYERAYIANKLNATLFVSIHHNSSTDYDRSGTITYYSASPEDGLTFTGKSLADMVNAHLADELPTVNLGVIADTYIVTKNTDMPSILVEVAHMSNDEEFKKILQPEFQNTAAKAISKGVKEALTQVAQ